MQSFGPPRPTTNPYIVMLAEALGSTEGIEMQLFSWRHALRGKYDVFHFHWPETLLGGTTLWKAWARTLLFATLLLRLRMSRIAVVRTVHNLDLPEDVSALERLLLRRVESMTRERILISSATHLPEGQSGTTILHGHYRDWYGRHATFPAVCGQLAFVGLVRRYKGVERLLDAFHETEGSPPPLTLTVSGRPSSPELESLVVDSAHSDPRIRTTLRHLEDDELVRAITEAELVVLPYRFMHNSGSALAALSLQRPVLVPHNEANVSLNEEVGPGWVHTYTGELSSQALLRAVNDLRRTPPPQLPDLSQREWDDTGAAHRAVYLKATTARTMYSSGISA